MVFPGKSQQNNMDSLRAQKKVFPATRSLGCREDLQKLHNDPDFTAGSKHALLLRCSETSHALTASIRIENFYTTGKMLRINLYRIFLPPRRNPRIHRNLAAFHVNTQHIMKYRRKIHCRRCGIPTPTAAPIKIGAAVPPVATVTKATTPTITIAAANATNPFQISSHQDVPLASVNMIGLFPQYANRFSPLMSVGWI